MSEKFEPRPDEPLPGARVHQLARVLNLGTADLLARLPGNRVYTLNTNVDENDVYALLRNNVPRKNPEDLVAPVVAAFAAAKASKEGWQEMTLAVLKNRLMAASEMGFDEADYGAPNMYYFARLYPTLLETISQGPQARVALVDPTIVPSLPEQQPPTIDIPLERVRVRADLWAAVMDYKSNAIYIWDPAEQGARRLDRSDVGTKYSVIQTVDVATVREWRLDLANRVAKERPDSELLTAVRAWADGPGSLGTLPLEYRSLWNAIQTLNVREVLTAFFAESGLEPPADMVVSRERRAPTAAPSGIRAFIRRCVDAMSDEELAALQIPARVALAASHRPSRQADG